uniref:Uncharacterized protein n=1 Tax=virus sp. ctEQ64 TaxID=2825809 RepID=A0A8S5RKG6_9VIRU|nr:MAG TPA: hypothetical protein [virus sp. ctEQ64]
MQKKCGNIIILVSGKMSCTEEIAASPRAPVLITKGY